MPREYQSAKEAVDHLPMRLCSGIRRYPRRCENSSVFGFSFAPTGATSYSPGLPGLDGYPGICEINDSQPQRGCVIALEKAAKQAQPRCG